MKLQRNQNKTKKKKRFQHKILQHQSQGQAPKHVTKIQVKIYEHLRRGAHETSEAARRQDRRDLGWWRGELRAVQDVSRQGSERPLGEGQVRGRGGEDGPFPLPLLRNGSERVTGDGRVKDQEGCSAGLRYWILNERAREVKESNRKGKENRRVNNQKREKIKSKWKR